MSLSWRNCRRQHKAGTAILTGPRRKEKHDPALRFPPGWDDRDGNVVHRAGRNPSLRRPRPTGFQGVQFRAQRADQPPVLPARARNGLHLRGAAAHPGFTRPANPQVAGFTNSKETPPADDAIDQAQTAALNASITVPAGHFNHVLKTLETSPLEPGVKEYKFYASGIGNISIWEDLMPNGQPTDRIELISVTHGPAAIPLPPAAWTGLAMMSALVLCGGVRSMLRHREMSIRRV